MLAIQRQHTPQLTDEEQAAYAASLTTMTDDDYVAETAKQVYDAGYDRQYGKADQRVHLCFKEADRRGKPWLYARSYNRAARDAGVDLDRTDLERAREPEAA